MWKIKIQSPAKINLHLDVSDPGTKEFHPLRSLFVMVSLFDEIIISEREDDCFIKTALNIPREENILYKTWRLCRDNHLYDKGLDIILDKKIPHGAGLGGGSSNAASLLRVLFQTNPGIKPFDYWKQMAAELGSDVPFFMESTAAVVSGRGEIIKAVKARMDYSVLIIYPDLSISTPRAFNQLDKFRESHGKTEWSLSLKRIETLFESNKPQSWPFHNSFTCPSYEEYPILKKIEETLLTNGADFAILSGSGSAMVGVFTSKDAFISAKRILNYDFPSTYAVIPLDIIPYGIVI